jgi:peptide/nickel transport system permease protein
MLKYTIRKSVSGVSLILVISTLTFVLMYLGGGDIARRILGPQATAEQVQAKSESLGLDRPLILQYFDWLASALGGDLGRSWFTGETVSAGIGARLTVTLTIVIGACLVSAVLAFVFGTVAATRGGIIDRVLQVFSVLGWALPGFLVALAFVVVFAINLGWFNATGWVPLEKSFGGWIASITLPIAALSVGCISSVAQQVRGSVSDGLEADYVRTLRSRGLSERKVIAQVLRNSAGPAIAVLGIQFIGLVGGAVVIEQVFALPGLGQLGVMATTNGDIPMVLGMVLVVAVVVVIVNLLIDLAQAWLNPKVRLS